MSRILACLSLLLLVVSPAAAQLPRPGEPIPLTLTPTAPSTPSLKYRLLPDQRDLVPGNAAAIYYRSLTMFVENRALLQEFQSDEWEHWFLVPAKDLPVREVRDKLAQARYLLHEVEVASHYRQCDWEPEGRPEGTSILPPDVSGLRRVAILLGVKARVEMVEGHFAEALQALQTGYTLAHHLGSGPSLGHVLVGEVVASLMNHQFEELLRQPGALNLYWTLTVLPRPYFDPEPAVQEEAARLEQTWPVLKRLGKGPMSAGQVRAAREEIRKSLEAARITPPDADREIDECAPEAREALLSLGMPADQVQAMPPFQAVALAALRGWRNAWDEYVKWFRVPNFQRAAGYREAAHRYREALGRLDKLFFGGMVQDLEIGSPATLEKVHVGRERLERQFAALRCVEAIRLHAAGHAGKLPATLGDVKAVPIPLDPITGEPFEYTAQGDRATLSAPQPAGEKPSPTQLLTYEITLRR
jgi:hypothetical protein